MTAADRLRAAVATALPDGWLVLKPGFDDFREADSGLREIVLAAVLPIVEEREGEIARLRARHNPEVCVDVQEHCAAQAHEIARLWAVIGWCRMREPLDTIRAVLLAARVGNWAAVRAAGVALPEETP